MKLAATQLHTNALFGQVALAGHLPASVPIRRLAIASLRLKLQFSCGIGPSLISTFTSWLGAVVLCFRVRS